MCFAQGSTEHMTAQCAMCHIFPPKVPDCPHRPLAICKSTANHPRFNVVHFRNAEIGTFNGCGYCKYAQKKPFTNIEQAWANPGWPGCCRPPKHNEYSWIPDLDWYAVSKHNSMQIPDVVLKSLESRRQGGPGGVTPPASPPQPRRGGSQLPNAAPPENRSPTNSQPASLRGFPGGSAMARTQSMPMAIPRFNERERERDRRMEELEAAPSSLEAYVPSRSGRPAPSGSLPNSSPLDQYQPRTTKETKDPGRKAGSSLLSPSRPAVATVQSVMSANIREFDRQQPRRSVTHPNPIPQHVNPSYVPGVAKGASELSKMTGQNLGRSQAPPQARSGLSDDFARMSLVVTQRSQESPLRKSSAGTDSDSTGTLTSTGGFTDYLSDESEAELQRLAEERAVQEEERRLEDREFGDARRMIKHMGLRPPREWNVNEQSEVPPPRAQPSARRSPQTAQQPLHHGRSPQQGPTSHPPAHTYANYVPSSHQRAASSGLYPALQTQVAGHSTRRK